MTSLMMGSVSLVLVFGAASAVLAAGAGWPAPATVVSIGAGLAWVGGRCGRLWPGATTVDTGWYRSARATIPLWREGTGLVLPRGFAALVWRGPVGVPVWEVTAGWLGLPGCLGVASVFAPLLCSSW
jgi:hypothetical protein